MQFTKKLSYPFTDAAHANLKSIAKQWGLKLPETVNLIMENISADDPAFKEAVAAARNERESKVESRQRVEQLIAEFSPEELEKLLAAKKKGAS